MTDSQASRAGEEDRTEFDEYNTEEEEEEVEDYQDKITSRRIAEDDISDAPIAVRSF